MTTADGMMINVFKTNSQCHKYEKLKMLLRDDQEIQ